MRKPIKEKIDRLKKEINTLNSFLSFLEKQGEKRIQKKLEKKNE